MTLPEPLEWVIGTLTMWHYAVWASLAGLCLWRPPKQVEAMPLPFRTWGAVFTPPILYCMVSLIAGQVFGDKYGWSQLWPAGFCLGAITSTAFLTGLLPALWYGKGKRVELGMMTFVFVPCAAAFVGLFFAVVWWVFPRVTGLGLIDLPQFSWGVHLHVAP